MIIIYSLLFIIALVVILIFSSKRFSPIPFFPTNKYDLPLIIKSLDLKENRFGFEPEVTAKVAKIPGIRIYEVGISYRGRSYAEGKKISWKDGARALYCIVKYGIS